MAAKGSRERHSTRGSSAFADSDLISAADLDINTNDTTVADRYEPPVVKSPSSSKSERSVKGDPPEVSEEEKNEVAFTLADLHDACQKIEAAPGLQRKPGQGGAPRRILVIDAVLISIAAWVHGGMRAACRHVRDPKNWQRYVDAVADAHPDDPAKRLSANAPTRRQVMRLLNRLCDIPEFEKLINDINDICIRAARFVGMFHDNAAFSTPERQNCLTGDLTEITKVTGVDKEQAVIVSARNDQPGERIAMRTDLMQPMGHPDRQSEATLATDMALEIQEALGENGDSLVAFIYDMALHAENADRCLDAGIVAFSKVQRTSKNHYAACRLKDDQGNDATFVTNDGVKVVRPLFGIDGTPAIKIVDDSGTVYYLKLNRIKTVRTQRVKSVAIKGFWAIPPDDAIDEELHGAVTIVRHNSTKTECKNKKRRSRALRVVPESDPLFALLFGYRQDIESLNGNLKSKLPRGRMRSVKRNRMRLDLATYQLHTVMMTLINYRIRTGDDLSPLIGLLKLRI